MDSPWWFKGSTRLAWLQARYIVTGWHLQNLRNAALGLSGINSYAWQNMRIVQYASAGLWCHTLRFQATRSKSQTTPFCLFVQIAFIDYSCFCYWHMYTVFVQYRKLAWIWCVCLNMSWSICCLPICIFPVMQSFVLHSGMLAFVTYLGCSKCVQCKCMCFTEKFILIVYGMFLQAALELSDERRHRE